MYLTLESDYNLDEVNSSTMIIQNTDLRLLSKKDIMDLHVSDGCLNDKNPRG